MNISKVNILNNLNREEKIISIVILLYAFDFLGIGQLYPLLLAPYAILKTIKTKISYTFLTTLFILFSFCLLYNLIVYQYGFADFYSSFGKMLYPIIFLIVGYLGISNKNFYDKIFYFILLFIIGLNVYSFFSVIYTSIKFGGIINKFHSSGDRNILSFWNGNPISATALTGFMSFGLCLLPIILFVKLKLNIRLLFIYLFISSLYSTYMVSSRTSIAILFLSIILFIIFQINNKRNIILNIFFLSVTLIIISALKYFDLFSRLQELFLFKRIFETDLKDDSRILTWEIVTSNIINYPLGGREIPLKIGYAHNLWLDVVYNAGVIPFIMLIIFSLLSLFIVISLLMHSHYYEFNIFIVILLVPFYIIFMLEPVLQGLNIYFVFYCFFIGVIIKTNEIMKGSKYDFNK